MSIIKRLLELSTEYQDVSTAEMWPNETRHGRSLEEIAAEYEVALTEFVLSKSHS
jgi:hypothetical protein